MVTGSGVVALGGLIAATTDSFLILLLTQFLWGVGNNIYMVGREVAAADLIQPHQRGRFLSILFGLHSAGMAFGPVIGGILTDQSGLDILFLVYGGAGLVAMLLALPMKDTRPQTPIAVKASFLGFGKLSEIHPYFRLTYVILMVMAVSAIMRMTVVNSMLPLHGDELGYSATRVGSIFGVFSVVSLLVMFPGGLLSDKIGRKAAVVPAALISAAVFAAMPFTTSLSQIVALVVFMGVANGMSLGLPDVLHLRHRTRRRKGPVPGPAAPVWRDGWLRQPRDCRRPPGLRKPRHDLRILRPLPPGRRRSRLLPGQGIGRFPQKDPRIEPVSEVPSPLCEPFARPGQWDSADPCCATRDALNKPPAPPPPPRHPTRTGPEAF